MNFLDLLLAIPIGWFVYRGIKRGLIFELFSLLGLIVGIYAAIKFSAFISEKIAIEGEYSILITFFITFVAVVLLSMFLGKCVEGFIKVMKMGVLNNILGGTLGLLKAVCIISILLYYITLIDSKHVIISKSVEEKSLFYQPIEKAGNLLIGNIKTYVAIAQAKRNSYNKSL